MRLARGRGGADARPQAGVPSATASGGSWREVDRNDRAGLNTIVLHGEWGTGSKKPIAVQAYDVQQWAFSMEGGEEPGENCGMPMPIQS